jgi:hypothetical protein
MNLLSKPAQRNVPIVRARQADEPRVLSIGQLRLWYLSMLLPDSSAYNLAYASRIRGSLDKVALEKAFSAVICRHEALRTAIVAPGGTPVPLLLKKWSAKFTHVDLRHCPEEQRETETRRLFMEESLRPFNFARDVMLRGMLARLGEQEYFLLHVAPHLAFERGSVAVLFRDLRQSYEQILNGMPAALLPLEVQYCDYALWQRNHLQGERLESLSNYWRGHLTGAPTINFPLDYPRPAIHTSRGSRDNWVMPPNLLTASHRLFSDSGTTDYRGLFAAFLVLLYCYTKQTDLSVGSPFSPRCTGIEDLIGFFVNTVVLRVDVSGNPTFREVMRHVDGVVSAAIEHSDLTFDKVVEVVGPKRDSSRTPLFQVNFRAPKTGLPTLELPGITAERAEWLDVGSGKFDLAMEIESSCGDDCQVDYCVDLFKTETIEQIVSDFQTLLRGLVDQPDTRLEAVPEVLEISLRIRQRRASP